MEKQDEKCFFVFTLPLVPKFCGFYEPVFCLFSSLPVEAQLLSSSYSFTNLNQRLFGSVSSLTVCDNILFCANVTKLIARKSFPFYDSKLAKFDE